MHPYLHIYRLNGRTTRVTIEAEGAVIELPIIGFEHRESADSPGETIIKSAGMRTRFHDSEDSLSEAIEQGRA